MSRTALALVLLGASPVLAGPFNSFDGKQPDKLQVDAVSGPAGEETAATADEPLPGEIGASEYAPAKEPEAPAIRTTGTAKVGPAQGEATTSVALLEPAPAAELKDTTVPTVRPHLPKPTPRFDIGAGVFLQSRALSFLYDTYVDGPPSYEEPLQGFAVAAAVYPFPIQKTDGKLSGIGFSFKIARALGASVVASDETGTGEFDVQHTSYDAAVRYRHLVDKFAVEGEVAYGGWNHTIVDLPESIAVPDTSYNYLALGARGEVFPGDRASIAATARYLHVPSSGDITSEDWFGSGEAHGWLLGGEVTVQLPSNLFLRGGVEWRRITIEFTGTGYLAEEWGVWQSDDSQITGTALFGAQF